MKKYLPGAIVVAFVALPLIAAIIPPTNRFVSPNFPILIDTNGDGRPDGGDSGIVPTYDNNGTITIPNPWEDCGPAVHNVFKLGDQQDGVYRSATRDREGQSEMVDADTVTPDNHATHFEMLVQKGPSQKNGQGGFIDTNGDGILDAFQATGDGGIDILIDLTFFDVTGDFWADYASIPWSESSALGVTQDPNCPVGGGGSPQIFVPMADTDGDDKPDSVALDLDNNRLADPPFLMGPKIGPVNLAPRQIPTASEWALILMALGLATVAWLQFRRRGFTLGI